MRRKNLKAQGEEGEWIMSYADTVTLLLCFFVIFFSEAKVSQESDKETVKEIVSKYDNKQVLPIAAQIKEQQIQEHLKKLKTELRSRLEKESLKNYQIIQNGRDIFIRLGEKGFFTEGSFLLLPEGKSSLVKIAESIKNMEKDLVVYVEGHTDSKPVRAVKHYSSNLGLSSLRASSAAEVLISHGVSKSKIKTVGFGDTQPIASDRLPSSVNGRVSYDEEKARLNRRIEIRLLSNGRPKN